MKFHQLKITNIASLKGTHEIDFDLINKTAHLFAITGPTGAGKSTILNCISLALYGEVYKEGSNSLDFVTLGEPDGEITLTFSVQDVAYESFWSLRVKKKNGEDLKKPKLNRILYKLENNDKIAIDNNIEDITKLSFNQFCKTTILNQGQFAKFLTSSFSERKDILEKFYHGQDITILNNILKEKIKKIRKEYEEKGQYIKGLMENESLDDYDENKHNLLKEELSEFQIYYENVEIIVKKVNDLTLLTKNQETNKERLIHLNNEIEIDQKKYNETLAQEKAQREFLSELQEKYKKCKPDLQTALKLEVSLRGKEEQYESFKKESYEKSKNLEIKITSSKKLKDKIQNLNKSLLNLNDEIQVQNIDKIITQTSLEEIKNDLEDFKFAIQKHAQLKERTDYIKDQISKNNEQSLQYKNQLISIDQERKDDSLKRNKLDNELKKNEERQQLLVESIPRIEHLELEIAKKKDKNNLDKIELQKWNDVLAKENKELASILFEINNVENEIKSKRMKEAIHLCQKESIKLGHCIVCEAKDIGPLSGMQDHESDKKQEDLSALKEKQSNILKAKELAHIKVLSIEKSLNEDTISLKELKGSKDVQFNKLHTFFSQEMPLNRIEDVQTIHRDLRNRILILSKRKEQRAQLDQKFDHIGENINYLKKQREELNLEFDKFTDKKKISEKEMNLINEKYNKKRIESIFDFAQKKHQLEGEIKTLNKELTYILQGLNELKKDIESVDSRLNILKETIISETEEIKKLSPKGPASEQLENWDQLIDDQNQKMNTYTHKTRQIEIQLAEKKSRLHSITEQSQQVEYKCQQIMYELTLISHPTPPNICLTEINNRLQKWTSGSIEIQNLNVLEVSFKKLQTDFNDIKEMIHSKKDEVSKLDLIKKQIAAIKEKITSALNEQNKIKSELIKWENLNELLAKDEFRNYVLAIIEQVLIEQTNNELKHLYDGRYSLIQTNKMNRMLSEFKIKDHFLDDQMRKISTLSGGETFLVSLAMALALAEMTRGEASIDSLFIDEGFGTLDEDTIEDVYELLQEIEKRQKNIGIISHVKKLTEKIPVNIQLSKNIGGLSEVSLIFN